MLVRWTVIAAAGATMCSTPPPASAPEGGEGVVGPDGLVLYRAPETGTVDAGEIDPVDQMADEQPAGPPQGAQEGAQEGVQGGEQGGEASEL